MNILETDEARWRLLQERIAGWTGLHFAPGREEELQRAIAAAAADLGTSGAAECVDKLLASSPSQDDLGKLAQHLTIGETYFFRDPELMDALAQHVLPELIADRRGAGRFLRLWSAGCCTGEEPYTLAIILERLLPHRQGWELRISATDIHPGFIAKAQAGVYGAWSFRGVPQSVRQRYFEPGGAGSYAILPSVKRMVDFSCANLAAPDDVFRVPGGVGALDLIVCRNVLMYFTPAAMAKAIARFHRALAPGGWLVVSASELSGELFRGFSVEQRGGVHLYRKAAAPVEAQSHEPAVVAVPLLPATAAPPHVEVNAPPLAPPPAISMAMSPAASPASTARALADQGRLAEALVFCERWIAAHPADAVGHYTHAAVLLEGKDSERARASLRRSVYLDARFVMAHVALGNLARGVGLPAEMNRHFWNARELLAKCPAHEPVAEGDGLTAGQLAGLLASMAPVETCQ